MTQRNKIVILLLKTNYFISEKIKLSGISYTLKNILDFESILTYIFSLIKTLELNLKRSFKIFNLF